jgi:hypothetical protein
MTEPPNIPGADEFVSWFGRWPSFHDAEVVSLKLERAGQSQLSIHCFHMTSQVDASGHYATEKHALATFSFVEVTDCELYGFNCQNVLSGLLVQRDGTGHKIALHGCYGLEGWLTGTCLRLTFVEGIPPRSVYGAASTQPSSSGL